jgi:2'-5' RNA ligase
VKHILVLAIPAGEAVADIYPKIQSDLAHLQLQVYWTKPDQLFLQLSYLGRITDDQTPSIFKAVSKIVASTPTFNLTLNYLDTLYLRHEPSQIFLSPAKNSQLISLQKELSQKLTSIEIPQPAKFLPQVVLGTLERADPTVTKHQLDKLIDYELENSINLQVNKINLFEIFSQKKSLHYQRIGTFAMQKSFDDLPKEAPPAPSNPDIPPAE